MTDEFVEFTKIPRLSREVFITEKIDGTNAQVCIQEVNASELTPQYGVFVSGAQNGDSPLWIRAGSRNRWVTPDNDNFGFARWVYVNAAELVKLGPGRHYGEWWGQGIQRGYGIDGKRFSLFNVHRWCAHNAEPWTFPSADPRVTHTQTRAPECCHVVPVLYRGQFDTVLIDDCVRQMRERGSVASPGFMKPEGIIVYHTAGNLYFKKTLEKDEMPKALVGKVA